MRNSQPPTKAPTTPNRMSSTMPSPLLFTSLLAMNPEIRPRTIQTKKDIVSPFWPVNGCSEEVVRPSAHCHGGIKCKRSYDAVYFSRLHHIFIAPRGLVRHVRDHMQTHGTHKGEYEVTGKIYA